MVRRLTLTIPSLSFGGAERVLAQLANHYASRDDAVTVITLSGASKDTYPLDPRVSRVALGMMRESRGVIDALSWNLVRVSALRAAIAESRPDNVISFTDKMNITTLLACRPLGVDAVIAERIDPSRQQIGRVWSWLRRKLYPSARALVVQTDRVRAKMVPVMRGKPIYVIPNAVEPPPAPPDQPAVRPKSQTRWIVGMGRLDQQKGFDLLIDAFAKVASRHQNWNLQILGEGAARTRLEERINQHGLQQRVFLPGWLSEAEMVWRDADLFVLSSRYEGFPNVLLEAMARGVASIAFDCECGPAEIIRHEIDGLLVRPQDVAALSAAMDRAIRDEGLRSRLGDQAQNVVERFSVDRFYARWNAVLEKDPPENVL